MIITSRNNASISNFGGGFRWKSEYPWCIIQVKSKHFPTVFKKIEKNKKKNDGKTGIFTQKQFSTVSIFSPNVYVSVIYIHTVKFTKIFDFFDSNFYEICRKRKNLQVILKLKNNKIVDKIFLSLTKYLKILYEVPHILTNHLRSESITSRNNAPISNYGSGSRCKSEYPWCIIEFSKKSSKTKKKITEKRQFLRKTSFRPNRCFFFGCNSKTNH
ncbi:hypothetical protein AGLY_008027 [Aphis glycines]|uniref:Uncharacterized protein n=1 Tax=Aphis glycines TaxID=307491 RepID=A0A6G0TKN2_APHGL|nr:hypothetical protein AGLY_008027 [Aphis glycines]